MPTLATNKRVFADFHVLEEFEAGIALSGPEVKSVKASNLNLKGSYISLDSSQHAWITGMHIGRYKPATAVQTDYDPTRQRQLLLSKKELDYLTGKSREAGLTILPLSVYTKGSLIKVKLGLVRGKKKFDKRESIKKRETDRSIRRALRGKH